MSHLIVGSFLKQFGPVSVGAPPAIPTLTGIDNGDGTSTFTITGSTAGSTNELYTNQSIPMGPSTDQGGRVGDGTLTIDLTGGYYYFHVVSSLDGLSSVSQIYFLIVGTSTAQLADSPANIVRTLLVQMSLATEPTTNEAWPAFASREPDLPDNTITCYNTSGRIEGQTNTDNEVQEHYGVQLRVRAALPDDCFMKIKALITYLDEQVIDLAVSINNSSYLVKAISRVGGILDSGNEVASSKRTIMTVNTFVSIVQLL